MLMERESSRLCLANRNKTKFQINIILFPSLLSAKTDVFFTALLPTPDKALLSLKPMCSTHGLTAELLPSMDHPCQNANRWARKTQQQSDSSAESDLHHGLEPEVLPFSCNHEATGMAQVFAVRAESFKNHWKFGVERTLT